MTSKATVKPARMIKQNLEDKEQRTTGFYQIGKTQGRHDQNNF